MSEMEEDEGDPLLGRGVTPVDTQGLCFLCLVKVEPDWEEGLSSSSSASLQYLWRYVKLDPRKVVAEDEGHNLRAPSKLIKVSLCGACSSLNGGLSELFRRLEEIELEITANLNYVLGKMTRADETGVGELFRKGMGGGKIGEKLRKLTMEKCAHKLRSNLPQVQIIPESPIKQEVCPQRSRSLQSIAEPDHEPTTSYLEPDDLFLGGASSPFSDPVGSESEAEVANLDLGGMDSSSEEEVKVKSRPKKRKRTGIRTGPKTKIIRSSSLKRKPKVPPIITNSILDPATSLRKCKQCSEEFSSAPEFLKHFKETHCEKLQYECTLCGKVFAQKTNYDRHHQNFHMGIRFRCHECSRTFTLRCNFRTHQKKYNCFGKWSKEVAPLSERPRRGRRPKLRPPVSGSDKEVDSDLEDLGLPPEGGQVEGEGEGNEGSGEMKILKMEDEGDTKAKAKAKSRGPNIICTPAKQNRLELGNNSTLDAETGLRKCNICLKEFRSAPAFGNHYRDFHLKLRYQCKECGEEFVQKGNYTRHHQNKHMGIKFKCKICSRLFSLKSNLRKHQRTNNCGVIVAGRLPEPDVIAPEKEIVVEPYTETPEEERLKREQRQVVEVTVGGARVGKTNSRVVPAPLIFQEEVGTPEGSLNQEGKHECSICQSQFKDLKVFETHFKTIHLKRRYRCEPCGRVFSYHQAYTAHYQKVHIRVNFKCPYCDQGFTKKSKVKEHQKETGCGGEAGSEPIQQCEQCGKEFSKLVYLNRHVKAVHLNLRPHVCEKCGKTFNSSAHLKNHLMSAFHKGEDGEGPLQCSYCEKRFWRKDYLNSHLRIHTGEKPYQCEHCGKDFAAKSNYNKHQEMHRRLDSGRKAPVPGPPPYGYF